MNVADEYMAILRCQTWNIWPEKTVVEENPFFVDFGADKPLLARIAVLSYQPRSKPELYLEQETSLGPLLWDGKIKGLHLVRDTILKAPEDTVEIAYQHRHPHKGEIDICINFRFPITPTPELVESLRASAFAVIALLNLKLSDYLIPTAPFQIRRVLPSGGAQLESTILMAVHNRRALSLDQMKIALTEISISLHRSVFGPKFRVALELYTAHFMEQQTRVRFLLLVIAIETLAPVTQKHDSAVSLLKKWKIELQKEIENSLEGTEERFSFEALSRELTFRADDSIRTQVRKLFSTLPSVSQEETLQLQHRALRVYDKRSMLVHNGHLPAAELAALEIEARALLEKVFLCTITNSDSGFSTEPVTPGA
jgi:hypothetical protein